MKRIVIPLLLMALLLGGCGTRTPEAETSETPNASAAAPNTEIRPDRQSEQGERPWIRQGRSPCSLVFTGYSPRTIF